MHFFCLQNQEIDTYLGKINLRKIKCSAVGYNKKNVFTKESKLLTFSNDWSFRKITKKHKGTTFVFASFFLKMGCKQVY